MISNSSPAELAKSIGIGIGVLSCIGIGIVKTIFEVLVLVLVLLRGFPKYWYWYWPTLVATLSQQDLGGAFSLVYAFGTILDPITDPESRFD